MTPYLTIIIPSINIFRYLNSFSTYNALNINHFTPFIPLPQIKGEGDISGKRGETPLRHPIDDFILALLTSVIRRGLNNAAIFFGLRIQPGTDGHAEASTEAGTGAEAGTGSGSAQDTT